MLISSSILWLCTFYSILFPSVSANFFLPRLFGHNNDMDHIFLKRAKLRKGDFLYCQRSEEYRSGKWRSTVSSDDDESEERCELEIINALDSQILFCWVRPDGCLSNFDPINDDSINDGSVSNHHVELTHAGHAFVGIRQTASLPVHLNDVTDDHFVFLYKPLLGNYRHIVRLSHAYRPFGRDRPIVGSVKYTELESSDEVIDSSQKVYDTTNICGFTVKYEPGVFDSCNVLREVLQQDFEQVCRLLPERACVALQKGTKFWVNQSIVFGTVKKPVMGRSCTFHPQGGESWLRSMGMHLDKSGDIEIYNAQAYVDARSQWGVGGILLHELCHAFHNKHCRDGYENHEIRQAYLVAMERRMYDCVSVHGSQGTHGPTKAYACANCMEFFAELSVAYHWADDDGTEYNKWFPHNRAQLLKHDPDSFSVLHNAWTRIASRK